MPSANEMGSRQYIIRFYREQLRKFDKIGIGKRTEWDTMVTQTLIDTTKKRLDQLVIKGIKL